MIKRHVSAVLTIADGFSGRALASHEAVFTLDGDIYKPIYRDGGCFVFCDLPDGKHEIAVASPFFLPETLSIDTSELKTLNLALRLKPAGNYRFTDKAALFALTLKTGRKKKTGIVVCLAQKIARDELKIASDETAAGNLSAKIFIKSYPRGLVFPCVYLIDDGEDSEFATVTELAGGVAYFTEGLKKPHKRGKSMYPAQLYSGFGNELHAALRLDGQSGSDDLECAAFWNDGGEVRCKCFSFKLSAGSSDGQIEL